MCNNALESYQTLAKHFEPLASLWIEDINSQSIDKWLAQLKDPNYKLNSTRLSYGHEVSLLRNVFAYYREYFNEKFENPVRRRHDADAIVDQRRIDERKKAEKHKFISGADIEIILENFKAQAVRNPLKKMYLILAMVQLRTGLRVGEACALRWEDINWETGIVEIAKTVQWMRTKSRPSQISQRTKTGSDRFVRLIPQVLEELKGLQRDQERIAGLIFSDDGVKIATYRSIQHHYEFAFRAANVDMRSTHIMRHSFATQFLELTRDNHALQGLLGHSSLKMTEKYAKVTNQITMGGMLVFEQKLGKT